MNGRKDAMLTFALRGGSLVYVDEAENGLQCGCVCPACGAQLVAVNGGSITEHHFRHYNAEDCGSGGESALHLLGKELLRRDKELFLPEYPAGGSLHTYESCLLERPLSPFVRPDVLLLNPDERLNVEIRVTHAVDEEKCGHLAELGLATVEIDLSGLVGTAFTEDSVRQLIRSGEHTHWVYHPDGLGEYQMSRLCDYLPIDVDGFCYCPLRQKRMDAVGSGTGTCSACRFCRRRYRRMAGGKGLPCAWRFRTLQYKAVEEIQQLRREYGQVTEAQIRVPGGRLRLSGEYGETLTVKFPEKFRNGHIPSPYRTAAALWKTNYESMIILNCETGRSMYLRGHEGRLPVRDGRLVGRYTERTCPGYEYTRKLYPVWGAGKAVWTAESVRMRHK